MKKVTCHQLPLISNSGSIYSLSGIKRLGAALNRMKIHPAAKRVDDPERPDRRRSARSLPPRRSGR